MANTKTRALVFSTLFPNAAQPNHGVFVENRLRHTVATGELDATVVAPVPYFPFSNTVFGRYAAFARAPKHETRHGLQVWHPRYPVVPKIGARLTPYFLYRAGLASVRGLQRRGLRFDVIDAHYFYPDGVAAALLARALGLPLIITARGTDLTLIAQDPAMKAPIQWAIQQASVTVAVCEELRQRLLDLGAPEHRSLALRNGVDLELFRVGEREAERQALGVKGFTILSVGSLIPRKGHHLAIEAVARCPDCTLLIAGDGPLRPALAALADRLGARERVRLLGETPHAQLPSLYGAADVLLLASEREGWANVLLEAMACGTPVIATDVNGTAEVVKSPEAGRLVTKRSPAAIVEALTELRASMPRRDETRAYAEKFGWHPIAQANSALLRSVAEARMEGRDDDKILAHILERLAAAEAAQPNA